MKYTGCIFKTKTKKIVCKELVGAVEGPSEALKCAMRRISGNPAIGRFNVNGSKETTRAHESGGIIDRFVVIGTTGNMIVDRVIKRATHVCNVVRWPTGATAAHCKTNTFRIKTLLFLCNCSCFPYKYKPVA